MDVARVVGLYGYFVHKKVKLRTTGLPKIQNTKRDSSNSELLVWTFYYIFINFCDFLMCE